MTDEARHAEFLAAQVAEFRRFGMVARADRLQAEIDRHTAAVAEQPGDPELHAEIAALKAELALLADVFPPTLPLEAPRFVPPGDAVSLAEFTGTASERFDKANAAAAPSGRAIVVPPGDWRITKPIPVTRDGAAFIVPGNPGPNFAMLAPVPSRIICDFHGPAFEAPGSLTGFAAHNLTITAGSASGGVARCRLWSQPNDAVLAAAWFHSIALFGTAGGIGDDTRSVGGYQVLIDGQCQAHGFTQTPFRARGSEWWFQGFLNNDSPATGAPGGNGRPMLWFDQLEKSHAIGIYLTARNGWSPFRQSGGADRGLNHVTHSVLEGYKAHTPATAPIKMDGGALDLAHLNINYFAGVDAMIDHTKGHLILGPGIGSKLATGAESMPLVKHAAGTTHEDIGTPIRYVNGRWQP